MMLEQSIFSITARRAHRPTHHVAVPVGEISAGERARSGVSEPLLNRAEPAVPVWLAQAATALGAPVFPCDAEKRPLTRRGFYDASSDPATVRRMFARCAARMIGAPTGRASDLIVVDVDVKDGARGLEWLERH